MKNKNTSIRIIAVVCSFILLILTAFPGCSLVGQTSDKNNNSNVDANAVVDDQGNQLCCPVCNSTDIAGPDDKNTYSCNNCGNKWSYSEDSIDIVDDQGDVIGSVDSSAGYVSGGSSGGSYSGGSSGSSSSGSSSSVKPNANKTTTPTTKKSALKMAADALKDLYDITKAGVGKVVLDKDGNYTSGNTSADTGYFGFKYNTKDKIFITAEDAWQRNFGYEETYDKTAGAGAISYDTIRVYFTYENKDWMVQFWKGQYGIALVGAEIGLYYRDTGVTNKTTYYDCVSDNDKLYMSMDFYQGTSTQNSSQFSKKFTRSKSKTWWLTGFTPGTLKAGTYVVPESGTKLVRVDSTIYFNTAEQAQAFIAGLNAVDHIYHNSPSRKRAISFKEYSVEEYSTHFDSGRYAVMDDGKTVLVSWR